MTLGWLPHGRDTIGNQWRDLNVAGNLDRKAVFENVSADAAGTIQVKVSVSPEGNSRLAYLGVIELAALQ